MAAAQVFLILAAREVQTGSKGMCLSSPQEEYHRLLQISTGPEYLYDKFLPAPVFMAVGKSALNGKHRIQHQDAPLCSGCQVAGFRNGNI